MPESEKEKVIQQMKKLGTSRCVKTLADGTTYECKLVGSEFVFVKL